MVCGWGEWDLHAHPDLTSVGTSTFSTAVEMVENGVRERAWGPPEKTALIMRIAKGHGGC